MKNRREKLTTTMLYSQLQRNKARKDLNFVLITNICCRFYQAFFCCCFFLYYLFFSFSRTHFFYVCTITICTLQCIALQLIVSHRHHTDIHCACNDLCLSNNTITILNSPIQLARHFSLGYVTMCGCFAYSFSLRYYYYQYYNFIWILH